MLPHDVILEAARLIEAGGHSQGCHARDAFGREVPLHVTGSTETGRASINPAAVQFSMYGAVAAVLARNPSNPSAIWPILAREAKAALAGIAVPGGTNYLHPLILLNEHMDTSQEVALAFLERCALLVEPSRAASEVANG